MATRDFHSFFFVHEIASGDNPVAACDFMNKKTVKIASGGNNRYLNLTTLLHTFLRNGDNRHQTLSHALHAYKSPSVAMLPDFAFSSNRDEQLGRTRLTDS